MKFNEMWASQLKAAALEVAENAESIVGELNGNIDLTVSIELASSNGETIGWPTISISRTIASRKAIEIMKLYRQQASNS